LEQHQANQPTPLIRVRDAGFPFANLDIYLKFEGANPTGTQKDRIASLHVQNAVRQGFREITVGTCGNYGAAIAYWSRIYGLRSKIFVPVGFHAVRLFQLGQDGFEVIRGEGFVEDLVDQSRLMAQDDGYYDANPGSKNRFLDEQGYSEISREIVAQLGAGPASVLIPVGNGTTLHGMYVGFSDLRKRGIIDSIPRIVAIAPKESNPIVDSILSRHPYRDLEPTLVEVTATNEPLAGYRSIDGNDAVSEITESSGFAISVTDEEMLSACQCYCSSLQIDILPASASVLAALRYFPREMIHEGPIVCLITGRRNL